MFTYQHDCLLPCPWWGSDLWPLLCLAKETLLLRKRFQFLMTRLLSWPINRYALISIYLSMSYLTSSNMAHDPIPISGPFFPTITPQNSTILLLGKKGDFDFWRLSFLLLCRFFLCRCLFNCKGACFWCFGIRDVLAFTSYDALSPTFYGVVEILWWGNFMGI